MRPVSDRFVSLLEGPQVTYSCRAESWYAGEQLTDALPVESGTHTTTADVIDTHEVAASVPFAGEFDLSDPLNPLGAYGQRVRVFIDLTGPSGEVESAALGWSRIMPSQLDNGVMDLRARDLSVEIERARLVTPVQLTTPVSANPATELFDPAEALEYLLTGILPVAVLDALPDLAGALYVMRDRRQGVMDILQAVSGTASVDVSGAFVITSVPDLTDPDSVLSFTDGYGADPTSGDKGTLVDLRPEANDSRGYNACIVQGVTAEGAPVYGGAFVEDGPMAWPVQPDVVSAYGANPGFFFSPLLRTVDGCKAAARSKLAGWMLGANGSFTVEAAPDPRLEVNDVVDLTKGGNTYQGLVQQVTLPLTAESGPMTFSGVLL